MNRRALFALAALATLAACTTAERISNADGEPEVLVACGASVSIGVCHERAAEECPRGYVTVRETGGFNRQELRVRCKP